MLGWWGGGAEMADHLLCLLLRGKGFLLALSAQGQILVASLAVGLPLQHLELAAGKLRDA